jgi:hypothetical protein
MHPAFESLKSYADFKGWNWSTEVALLVIDIQWTWADGVSFERQLQDFYEVFAQLLFENNRWAGFRLFELPRKFWPVFVNGRPVSHYHIQRNRYGLLEVEQ